MSLQTCLVGKGCSCMPVSRLMHVRCGPGEDATCLIQVKVIECYSYKDGSAGHDPLSNCSVHGAACCTPSPCHLRCPSFSVLLPLLLFSAYIPSPDARTQLLAAPDDS